MSTTFHETQLTGRVTNEIAKCAVSKVPEGTDGFVKISVDKELQNSVFDSKAFGEERALVGTAGLGHFPLFYEYPHGHTRVDECHKVVFDEVNCFMWIQTGMLKQQLGENFVDSELTIKCNPKGYWKIRPTKET